MFAVVESVCIVSLWGLGMREKIHFVMYDYNFNNNLKYKQIHLFEVIFCDNIKMSFNCKLIRHYIKFLIFKSVC